jgi:adenylate cyclase
MRLSTRQSKVIKAFVFFFTSWFIMGFLFVFIRYYDTNKMIVIEMQMISSKDIIMVIFLLSVTMGILSALTEPWALRIEQRNRPYFIQFMFKTQRYIAYIIPLFITAAVGIKLYLTKQNSDQWFNVLSSLIQGKTLYVALIYIVVTNILINSFRQMTRFVGDTEFWNYLIGKYSKRIEQERIFMFIDLESSTAIAEQLKNTKYSQLLRRFFYDISDVIHTHQGKVYQYVGDEAVISWNIEEGIANNNCINCFFEMKKVIQKNRNKYIENFQLVPKFKAAIHLGKSVAAEVGTYKNEIAFHGEVLNTTSRILAKCHELKSDILISGELYDKIPNKNKANINYIGEFILRGKQNITRLYSVNGGDGNENKK